MTLHRNAPRNGSPDSSFTYDAGSWGKPYPTILEFLTLTQWEDGTQRATGTLTLMAENGVFKCSLRDRDAGCYCFVSGKSPTTLLEALEKGLAGNSLDWRPDRAVSKPASRKG